MGGGEGVLRSPISTWVQLTLTPPSESVYGSQFFDAKLLQALTVISIKLKLHVFLNFCMEIHNLFTKLGEIHPFYGYFYFETPKL
jgi:hypothetical protein